MNLNDPILLSRLEAKIKYFASSIHRRVPAQVLLEDLISQGWVGVMSASQRYESSQGDFVTFASKRIQGEILDFLRRIDPLTRGHRQAIKQGTEAPISTVEIDAPTERSDGFQLAAIATANGVESSIQVQSLLRIVKLDKRSLTILRYKFIDDLELVVIGNKLGVSEGRVSQLLKAALVKLRMAAACKRICRWCSGGIVRRQAKLFCSRTCQMYFYWSNSKRKKVPDGDTLANLYQIKGWSIPRIARWYRTTSSSVRRALVRHSIKRRLHTSVNKCLECGEPVSKRPINNGRQICMSGRRCQKHQLEYYRTMNLKYAMRDDPLRGTRKTGRKSIPRACGKCYKPHLSAREALQCCKSDRRYNPLLTVECGVATALLTA